MAFSCTIILCAFLVLEYVGLHVPDKLMGYELRVLGCPQNKLSHITHLQKKQQHYYEP